jgi:hypothetical protein
VPNRDCRIGRSASRDHPAVEAGEAAGSLGRAHRAPWARTIGTCQSPDEDRGIEPETAHRAQPPAPSRLVNGRPGSPAVQIGCRTRSVQPQQFAPTNEPRLTPKDYHCGQAPFVAALPKTHGSRLHSRRLVRSLRASRLRIKTSRLLLRRNRYPFWTGFPLMTSLLLTGATVNGSFKRLSADDLQEWLADYTLLGVGKGMSSAGGPRGMAASMIFNWWSKPTTATLISPIPLPSLSGT